MASRGRGLEARVSELEERTAQLQASVARLGRDMEGAVGLLEARLAGAEARDRSVLERSLGGARDVSRGESRGVSRVAPRETPRERAHDAAHAPARAQVPSEVADEFARVYLRLERLEGRVREALARGAQSAPARPPVQKPAPSRAPGPVRWGHALEEAARAYRDFTAPAEAALRATRPPGSEARSQVPRAPAAPAAAVSAAPAPELPMVLASPAVLRATGDPFPRQRARQEASGNPHGPRAGAEAARAEPQPDSPEGAKAAHEGAPGAEGAPDVETLAREVAELRAEMQMIQTFVVRVARILLAAGERGREDPPRWPALPSDLPAALEGLALLLADRLGVRKIGGAGPREEQ